MTKLEEFIIKVNASIGIQSTRRQIRASEYDARFWLTPFVKEVRDRANLVALPSAGLPEKYDVGMAFNEIVEKFGLEEPKP